MKSFIFNLAGLLGSWQFIELSSENSLNSVLAPIVFGGFLISSILWFIVKFGVNQRTNGGAYFGRNAGSHGGDCGGGGDGGC
ncbi:hypothetical protein AUP74_01131 [Microbulbifer aggregans]|uniref:Uncharacterized protein n=1 Tax=Microbulbifer aggregans TaxID=1769779 RepID=A0A1C9W614_9GAMM|nr:hypothetical protein [Microbulbifer aggregans]AOS96594.1 hypothetical protein AUP74_01131 [Microbulbifer aggregans]